MKNKVYIIIVNFKSINQIVLVLPIYEKYVLIEYNKCLRLLRCIIMYYNGVRIGTLGNRTTVLSVLIRR